jgi:hypothetical protein
MDTCIKSWHCMKHQKNTQEIDLHCRQWSHHHGRFVHAGHQSTTAEFCRSEIRWTLDPSTDSGHVSIDSGEPVRRRYHAGTRGRRQPSGRASGKAFLPSILWSCPSMYSMLSNIGVHGRASVRAPQSMEVDPRYCASGDAHWQSRDLQWRRESWMHDSLVGSMSLSRSV